MRRAIYWLGVVGGVLLLAAGVTVGALGITASKGPADIVRDYLAALSRGDAARALAYGDVPPGDDALLTSAVLREQQRIAPLGDVRIGRTRQHGADATVSVEYTLSFGDLDVPVGADLKLHKSTGDWRLAAVAVPIKLRPGPARERESLLGGPVPRREVLLFPGALPIRLDTPYLKLAAFEDNITFGSLSPRSVQLQVTESGHAAMLAAVRAGLRRCLAAGADPRCPLPDDRYVPGSIRGAVRGDLRATYVLLDNRNRAGVLRLDGRAVVRGHWQRLDFHNRVVAGRGRIELSVHAVAYAVAPLRLRWVST